MCHLSDSPLINDSTRNHVVLICLSKLVTKEGFFNFGGACLHSEAKQSCFLRTLHVFLILQVAFLLRRLNVFLLVDMFVCQMMVSQQFQEQPCRDKKGGFFYPVRALFFVEYTSQFRGCYKKDL